MDSPCPKRHKLLENAPISSGITLKTICDWKEPRAIAIKHHSLDGNSREITYAQLAEAELTVSSALANVQATGFIGITSDNPAYCLPGLMLGIMRSGCSFVCLPSSLQEAKRICYKLAISHIISHGGQFGSTIEEVNCFEIHGERIFLVQTDGLVSPVEVYGYFAYATTTSGSTGEPKIVRVPHESIIPNILDLKRILQVSKNDTIGQLTPPTFDPSLIEIFLALFCNATLFTVSQELRNEATILLDTLVRSRVSILQSTPSLLLGTWSSEELKKNLLGTKSCLRILLLGGEDFPSETVLSKIRSRNNETRIFDIYGITEISCWSTIREIKECGFNSELGQCLSETKLEVRNEEGKRIAEGDGILHIGSKTRKCVIDIESITSADEMVFRDSGDLAAIDHEGRITLKGRRDRRVKRYGTRLCLTDLESHVRRLPYVENCYALFMKDNQSLHLFFTIFDKSTTKDEQIHYEMEVSKHTRQLADVYRPDRIFFLNGFKLSSNGKICRNFLKEYSAELSASDQTNACKVFENIWKSFLPLRATMGEESGFFDSGGTSIIALRIAEELSDKCGHRFSKIMGRLLANWSYESCQGYVSKLMSNIVEDDTNEETNIEKSFEGRAAGKSIDTITNSRNHEKQTIESSSTSTKPEIIIPWQKCRGRSSFPFSMETKMQQPFSRNSIFIMQDRHNLEKCVDASPTIFRYPGGKTYVTVGSHAGVICTVELRKENSICPRADCWTVRLPDRIEASILVVNDFRGIVGSYDTFLYCVDLKTGERSWTFKTGDMIKCTAVLCSRRRNVLFGSYDRKGYCVSLEDGTEVWNAVVGNGSITATPCIHDDLECVLFAALDGTCISLKQQNGQINWKNKLDHPIFSAPVILNDGIAVFSCVSGSLDGISTATGEKVWQVNIDGAIFSHLHVHTDLQSGLQNLIFGSENKCIFKLECTYEKVRPIFRFRKKLDAPLISTPSTDGRVIVAADANGNLRYIDFKDGQVYEGSLKLGGDVFSSPIIHDDFIVVGCRDDYLYILRVC